MKELLRCRAMESMCRQRASFYPGEAWKFLAEAEMWHHKAMDLISAGFIDSDHQQPLASPGAMMNHVAPN
jgi:hypothetical protein